MDAARSAARLKSTVRRAVRTATDSADFRTRILDALREQVPFDCAYLASMDPAVRVPTAGMNVGFDDAVRAAHIVFQFEYGPGQDPIEYDALMHGQT